MTSLSLFIFVHWRRKWQPTPVFLSGESRGRRSLLGCHLWGCTELDTTEATAAAAAAAAAPSLHFDISHPWNCVTPIGHPGSSPRSPTKMPSPSSSSGYFLLQSPLGIANTLDLLVQPTSKADSPALNVLLCGCSPLSLAPEAMCCVPHLFLCIFT